MFKNFKVRTKIIIIVVITALISLSHNFIRTYIQMDNVFNQSLHTGVNLALKASKETNTAMVEQSKVNLQNMANLLSKEISNRFIQAERGTALIADFIELSYLQISHVGKNIPKEVLLYMPENKRAANDTPFVEYHLDQGYSMNESIKYDLQKISEYNPLFSMFLQHNRTINNIYIGTESGLLYTVSTHANLPAKDLQKKEWYKKAIATTGRIWMDKYVNTQGDIVVICAEAFYYPNGKLAGAVALEIKYSDIIENVLSLSLINGSVEFLIGKNGTYIGKEPPIDTSRILREALGYMSAGKTKTKNLTMDLNNYYMFFSEIKDIDNWLLGLIVPIENVYAPIEETKIKIAKQIEFAKQNDKTIFSDALFNFIAIFTLTSFLLIFMTIILSNSITSPLKKLMQQIQNIGSGNLNGNIEIEGKDEFAELSRTFNKMSENLKKYIKDLEISSMQTEHLHNELRVAHIIQNNLLPSYDMSSYDSKIIDFHANMIPAEEVGGDFYDFFYMDSSKNKMCFVIADVSGNGIPAAIYMAQVKALVKSTILQTKSLTHTIDTVNAILCEHNESCMFVTLLILTIDLKTKECTILNCGHNNPIISIGDRPYEFLKMKNTTAIGISETSIYEKQKLLLGTNDKLYLYTDGFVEATNYKGEFFSKNRLVECANKNMNLKPKEFDLAIRAEIAKFTDGSPVLDDTTSLAIRIM